ncbi:MAG TPA: hypothetical protein VJ724_06765 [Tahibacter sp.]|nr:hypothetical protein [Tahibacter sp.]
MTPTRRFRTGPPPRQNGMVAILVAVIVLLATLLASVTLMRSVDTANAIAGNLSFRQGAVHEAERAYAASKSNIPFNGPASYTSNAALGYSATILPATTRPDVPDVLTSASGGIVLATLHTGNSVRYVVERLCTQAGPADPVKCIVPAPSVSGGSASNQTSDTSFALTGPLPAYRLTVRVDGPRNTAAYVQTIVR